MADPTKVIKGGLSAIRSASRAADQALEAKRLALEAANPQIKASEAYGQHEGAYMKPIFYDRMKVDLSEGKKGGPGFSGIQLVDPDHALAKAAAGVTDQKMATRILNRNEAQVPKGAKVIWTPSVGGLEQHKSNSTLFGKFADIFANQRKNMSTDEVQKLSDYASTKVDNKGKLIFPNGIDLGSNRFRQKVTTYNQRALMADIFAGRGVGGEKGRTVPVEELLEKNLDPNVAGAGTLDLGNRLFRLDGNVIDRPDLHTDYRKILTGEDLNVNYTPVPIRDVYTDWEAQKKLELLAQGKDRDVTQMDYTKNDPTVQLTEALLTKMQKAGQKKGGVVRSEESPEDMARFQKRFAMHKAIGGRVKKMAGGGRVSIFDAPAKRMASGGKASIFDKPVHMIDGGKVAKGVMGAVNKASKMADEKIAAQAIGKAAESAGMKAPVTANKPLTNLQDFHTSLGDRIRQGAVETQNMIESMPFKYDKGQRVFTDDSAKKNRAPYEILMRTRYGNQVMREDHPTLGPNMGQTIRDFETGKAKRTPYEPGYRVRGEIGEMILPESAIKGNVEKARGGLTRMAEGGESIDKSLKKMQDYSVGNKSEAKKPNELSGVVLAGASWMAGDEKTRLAREAFGQDVTNTAIGGQKTADVLNQLNVFKRDGGTFAPNTTVVLDIGANDIAQGVDEATIRANLNEIVSRLGEEGVQVILSGQPEANSYEEAISSTTLQMDDLYQDIAANNPNVTLVDAMSGMLNDKSLMDESGFHLNSEDAKLSYLNQFANAYKGMDTANQSGGEAPTNAPQEVEAQRPINIPDPAEIAEEKLLEDSDVIPTDTALDDSDPAETDTASIDSDVAEAIANLDNKEKEIAITEPGDNTDDYQPPQQVPIAPDYSRAYEALGGADVVNDLRDQFLGMGMNDNAIESVFSKYYPQEYEQEFAQEQFKRGGAVGRESPADMARFHKRFAMHKAIGGHVKKMANGGRASIFDAPAKRFDGGGIASPEESSGSPPDREQTKASLMAEFLAKAAKDQGKEELSSLKKPRALTDLLNRGVLANNPLSAGVDLFNLGLGAVGMGSEKPFLGSEHLKDLMKEYNVTSGEERPMMETALSFASPTAMIKGGMKATDAAKKAPELMKKASDAFTSSKLSPLATEAKTASAGKPTGATYATKQEGPFFRVSPTTLDTSKAKTRGIREGDELQSPTPLGGGAGSTGRETPQFLSSEEVGRIIADPVANEPLNIAKKYTQETQGVEFGMPNIPESSLAKQSAIGRAQQLAVEGSPEYKTSVFDAYAQQMPDVLEKAGAKNYDDLMEKAYRQLAKETDDQFKALPYNFSYHRAGEGNYNGAMDMASDVHGNKHLYVYQGGDKHDFLNRLDPSSGLNENEKFRAVHDLLGHAIYGNQFGPKGEEMAWAVHSQMYSPLARLAMTAETRGQNSMVNYSPLNANLKAELAKYDNMANEARRKGDETLLSKINAAKRQAYAGFEFAPNKAVLLPPEFLDPKFAGGMPAYLQAANRPAKGTETQSVLTHFSNDPNLQLTDPRRYGTGIKGAEGERLRDYAGGVRDRSYFYMGEPGTVSPESGLGVNRYRGEASSLYDITQDPLNFQTLARESNRTPFTAKVNQGVTYPLQDANDIERLIKEYGYEGMANPKATKPMAIMFKETPVRRQARGGLTLMK